MRKATATYNAPKGDSKVVEMGGVTFFDGQAVDLNSDEHAHLINKLPGNQHFDIDVDEDVPDDKPKRGRPSNADKAAKADPLAQQTAQLGQNALNSLNQQAGLGTAQNAINKPAEPVT